MKTYRRICIANHRITDMEGSFMEVKRGKEYLTSHKHEVDGHLCVTVFGSYWVPFPAELFVAPERFT